MGRENEYLKIKINPFYEKMIEESKTRLLKQFDADKRANIIISRMQKQMKRQEISAV